MLTAYRQGTTEISSAGQPCQKSDCPRQVHKGVTSQPASCHGTDVGGLGSRGERSFSRAGGRSSLLPVGRVAVLPVRSHELQTTAVASASEEAPAMAGCGHASAEGAPCSQVEPRRCSPGLPDQVSGSGS